MTDMTFIRGPDPGKGPARKGNYARSGGAGGPFDPQGCPSFGAGKPHHLVRTDEPMREVRTCQKCAGQWVRATMAKRSDPAGRDYLEKAIGQWLVLREPSREFVEELRVAQQRQKAAAEHNQILMRAKARFAEEGPAIRGRFSPPATAPAMSEEFVDSRILAQESKLQAARRRRQSQQRDSR